MEFDTLSQCSTISNPSDDLKSNVSTLSGLSNYQDEFAELRHLLDPLKYPTQSLEKCCTPKQESTCDLPYNEHISNLSNQLQNSLRLNEKYKNELYNLEKHVELKYYDKIDRLLKTNRKLKVELDNANCQINRLITNFGVKDDTHLVPQKNYILLEQKYHELTLQNSTLHFNLSETKNLSEESQHENKELKIEVNELKINLEAKNACVKELKDKVSQQHLEIESLLSNNVAVTQSLKDFCSELEHIKRTLEWYKVQLHACQKDKKILLDENVKNKIELLSQNETLDMLNLELTKCRNQCDLMKIEALKEREIWQKRIEKHNLGKSKSQTDLVVDDLDDKKLEFGSVKKFDKSTINYYESSIQDLTNEIKMIKEYVEKQDETNKKIVKENSDLTAHCIVLQKRIQQNEVSIEELENSKKFTVTELKLANEKMKTLNEELTSYKIEVFKIRAELKVRKEEKELIEKTIRNVREQFFSFKSKYKQIEDELLIKNRQILQLETEKQKLFMVNNWNICELEKNRGKDAAINDLKDIISKNEEKTSDYVANVRRLEIELQEKEDIIKTLEMQKQTIINNNSAEICRYENVFTQYKNMVISFEKQINEFKFLISKNEVTLTNIKAEKNLLIEELAKRDSELNKINTKCTMLESKLRDYEKEALISKNEVTLTNLKAEKNLLIEELGKRDSELDKINTKCTMLESKLRDYEKEALRPSDFEQYMKKIVSNNSFNITEVLQHFTKVCQFNKNENDDCKLKAVEDFLNMLKILEKSSPNLDKSEINKQNQQMLYKIKHAASTLEGVLNTKFSTLHIRVKALNDKFENCSKMLMILARNNSIRDGQSKCEAANGNDKIKELNVLLQVKEREMKEKQKKYEKNYRTLLRKVKEHMKGRNAAEKHNKYLQELYNSLADENNSLKLGLTSKDYEIDNVKKQLESYVNINNKLNQSVLSLEEEVIKNKICERCSEHTFIARKCEMLEKHITQIESEKVYIQNVLKSKEDTIVNLHQEKQEMLSKNASLTNENKIFSNELEEKENEKESLVKNINILETKLNKKIGLIEELSCKLKEESKGLLESNNNVVILKLHVDQLNDKVESLSKEIETLNSALQIKSEELLQLEDRKSKMECKWVKQEEHSQKTIATLKNYLHEMQIEMNAVNNEKYFLQRLCNDLKLGLKTYVAQNKELKEQLRTFSENRQDFNSLPNVFLDIPTNSKYDDTYINELLKQNKGPTGDKPLIEIKGCLDNLRKEISVLQDEISKKNIGR